VAGNKLDSEKGKCFAQCRCRPEEITCVIYLLKKWGHNARSREKSSKIVFGNFPEFPLNASEGSTTYVGNSGRKKYLL
jgi:hypothetical protein